MKKILVKVKGERYLMNRYNTDEGTTSSKKVKKVYVPADEAKVKEYRTKEGVLYIPCEQFEASIQNAGSDFVMEGRKKYKQYLKGGIYVEPSQIPMKPQNYEIHTCPAVINGSRITRWRPLFTNWSAEFTINITDEMINPLQLKEIVAEAGLHKGIGDWRPKFGRFEVTDWKVIDSPKV